MLPALPPAPRYGGANRTTLRKFFFPGGPFFGLSAPGIVSLQARNLVLKDGIRNFRNSNPVLFFEGLVPVKQQQTSIEDYLKVTSCKRDLATYQKNLRCQFETAVELKQLRQSNLFKNIGEIPNIFDYLEVWEAAFGVLDENNFDFYFDACGLLQLKDSATYNRLKSDPQKFYWLHSFLKYLYENYKADLALIHETYFEEGILGQRKLEMEYSKYLALILDKERLFAEYVNWSRSHFKSYDEIVVGGYVGKYRISKLLKGKGGMGVVAFAEDQPGKKVVIKIPSREVLEDASLQGEKRLIREGRICFQFRSKNNAKLLDLDSIFINGRQTLFLVFAYAEGKSLDDYIEERKVPTLHKLTAAEVFKIMFEVCLGLLEAHENKIIHKDLKNGNIIIRVKLTDPSGQTIEVEVTIIDYGIASEGRQKTFTAGLAPVGTAAYAAPEQHLMGNVLPPADVFALGMIMRGLLTGSVNEDENKREQDYTQNLLKAKILNGLGNYDLKDDIIGKNIPPDLRALIKKCLQFKPQDRPQNAAELFCELYNIAPPEIKKPYEGIIGEIKRKAAEINQKFGIGGFVPQSIPKPMPAPFNKSAFLVQAGITPPVDRGEAPVVDYLAPAPGVPGKLEFNLPREFSVLVVNNNWIRAKIWERALKQISNTRIEIKTHPQEALRELASGTPYDFMTVDTLMPGEDGFPMLDEVKNKNPQKYGENSALPTLMLSNLVGSQIKDQARKAGADDHIENANITPAELKNLVENNYFMPWVRYIARGFLNSAFLQDQTRRDYFDNLVKKRKNNLQITDDDRIEFVAEALLSVWP